MRTAINYLTVAFVILFALRAWFDARGEDKQADRDFLAELVYRATDPAMNLLEKAFPPLWGMDLRPLLAILIIAAASQGLVRVMLQP
ncbi:MAG: YggT family protein [Bacillota bacterium]